MAAEADEDEDGDGAGGGEGGDEVRVNGDSGSEDDKKLDPSQYGACTSLSAPVHRDTVRAASGDFGLETPGSL